MCCDDDGGGVGERGWDSMAWRSGCSSCDGRAFSSFSSEEACGSHDASDSASDSGIGLSIGGSLDLSFAYDFLTLAL